MATKVTYKLSAFDKSLAASGGLCVMVSKGYSAEEISNVEIVDKTDSEGTTIKATQANADFKGAGICRAKSPTDYVFTVNSTSYIFNNDGSSKGTSAIGWKLMMGEVQATISTEGSAVESESTVMITRGRDGTVIRTSASTTPTTKLIESLNARDEFAVEAMKAIIGHIPNPSELSDSEINFYCTAAYQWAANMMSLSANTRSTTVSESSSEEDDNDSTRKEEVTVFDNNIEKLLNNIIAALEKTDSKLTIDKKEVYAERQSNPEWNALWKAYIKHTSTGEEDTQTTVGLDDLVKAIKNIQLSGGEDGLKVLISFLPNFNIGNAGLGRDADNPIYISGGGFPSRQVLASAFASDIIHDFLTFNSSGAVGYSTLDEVKKAVNGWINSYTDLEALSTAVYNNLKSTILSLIDERCKAWLEAARITINDTEYSLTVNTPS